MVQQRKGSTLVGINAAIVDEHELTRIAIEEILNRASDIDFVGGFVDVGTFLAVDLAVDVLLLGCNLNQPDLAALMERLKQAHPDVRVIMLGRQWSEAGIYAVLDCGADGVVDRDEALHDLLAAGIRRVACGKQFLSPEIATTVTNASAGNNEQLTERELDVVLLMNDAANTNEMAAALGVSRRTINRLQTNICEKWCIRSRDQIVVEAVKRGIIRIRD